MAYTPNITPGNGSVTDFQVTFPYLRQAHVGVKVNGAVVAKTWVNAGFVRVSPAPAAGITVEVFRDTPTVPLATLQDNKPIPAASYNDLVKQALYYAEEQAYLTAKGTAGDRVQTGLDRAAVAADKVNVAADKATVATDRGIVAGDKATVAADKGTVAADKGTVAADKATVAADKASTIAARDLAQKWANEVEDTPVAGGQFSAFHWARKALGYVTGSIANAIHGAASKTTPVDADEVGIWNSVGGTLSRLSWLNIKTTLGVLPSQRLGPIQNGGALDADLMVETGWYFAAQGTANIPVNVHGYMSVRQQANTGPNSFATKQFWCEANGTRMFHRERWYTSGGTWGPWVELQIVKSDQDARYALKSSIGNIASRSLTISTAAPSGGVDGDVWLQVI